jgi:hypothetical protein
MAAGIPDAISIKDFADAEVASKTTIATPRLLTTLVLTAN